MLLTPESLKDGASFSSMQEWFAGTTPGQFGLGILAALWAYSGYNSVCALSEEFEDPKKDLPVGVFSGMITVIILYIFCNLWVSSSPSSRTSSYSIHCSAYLRVIDPEFMAISESVGYTFDMKVGGEGFAVVLSIAVMMATLGAAHSTVFGQAHMFYAAGRDGMFHCE